jgi:hypothetical protein
MRGILLCVLIFSCYKEAYTYEQYDTLKTISYQVKKKYGTVAPTDTCIAKEYLDSVIYHSVTFDAGDFTNSKFNKYTSFKKSKFTGKIFFEKSFFTTIVDFSYTTYSKGANYNDAILPDSLDFSNVNIDKEEIDFRNSKLADGKSHCYINLIGTDINKIKIDYNKFLLWIPSNANPDQVYRIYEDLLRQFKDLKYLSNYETLDIEYHNKKYQLKKDYFYKFWNFIDKTWWNYGYSKERVLYWTLFFLLFFTILSFLCKHGKGISFEYLRDKIYDYHHDEALVSPFHINKRIISAFDPDDAFRGLPYLIKRFFLTLTYISFIFFTIRLDFKELKPLRLRSYYIFIVYLVGTLCVAFLVKILII